MAERGLTEGAKDRSVLTVEHADVMAAHAGEAYRPSNGTEGDIFERTWCNGCRRGGANQACQIHVMAMAYSVGNPEYPREWVYGLDGQPCCSGFSDKHAPRRAYRCKTTDDLFGPAGRSALTEKGEAR